MRLVHEDISSVLVYIPSPGSEIPAGFLCLF